MEGEGLEVEKGVLEGTRETVQEEGMGGGGFCLEV